MFTITLPSRLFLILSQSMYSGIPNVKIEALKLCDADLNTRRMNDLMAVGEGANKPLYMQVVNRILRDMRLEQQKNRFGFSYAKFRRALDEEDLTPGQLNPLNQRLDTLESFMVQQKTLFGGVMGAINWKSMVRPRPKYTLM